MSRVQPLPSALRDGVNGNTSDFESEEYRFDPYSLNLCLRSSTQIQEAIMCKKVKYLWEKDARVATYVVGRKLGVSMYFYPCTKCNGYHISKSAGNVKRGAR